MITLAITGVFAAMLLSTWLTAKKEGIPCNSALKKSPLKILGLTAALVISISAILEFAL